MYDDRLTRDVYRRIPIVVVIEDVRGRSDAVAKKSVDTMSVNNVTGLTRLTCPKSTTSGDKQ